MQVEHELVDRTLLATKEGVVAKCTCGWESRAHFSSMSASVDFREHQEKAAKKTVS